MELDRIFSCAGKVAIVSGGAGLYGFAISEALCQAGATVVVGSRSDALFRMKVAAMKEKYPIHHHELDLLDDTKYRAAFPGRTARFPPSGHCGEQCAYTEGLTLEETSPKNGCSRYSRTLSVCFRCVERRQQLCGNRRVGVLSIFSWPVDAQGVKWVKMRSPACGAIGSRLYRQLRTRIAQRKRRENRSASCITKRIRTGWPAKRSIPDFNFHRTTYSMASPTINSDSASMKPGIGSPSGSWSST